MQAGLPNLQEQNFGPRATCSNDECDKHTKPNAERCMALCHYLADMLQVGMA